METLIGYVRAKEDIKKGHLVAILQKENGDYTIIDCIETCKDCKKEGHSGCKLN